jgi:hypothetical protein
MINLFVDSPLALFYGNLLIPNKMHNYANPY